MVDTPSSEPVQEELHLSREWHSFLNGNVRAMIESSSKNTCGPAMIPTERTDDYLARPKQGFSSVGGIAVREGWTVERVAHATRIFREHFEGCLPLMHFESTEEEDRYIQELEAQNRFEFED